MNKKQEKTIENYKEKLDEVKHELTLVKTKNADLSKLLEKCITSEKKSEEKIKALEKTFFRPKRNSEKQGCYG